MDTLLLLSIISGIAGIVGLIIQIIIEHERIIKLPSNPLTKKFLLFIVILSMSLLLFDLFILPRNEFFTWQDSLYSQNEYDKKSKNKNFLVRKENNLKTSYFVSSNLYSRDIFPTFIRVNQIMEKKLYFVGSYGSGLYKAHDPPNWEYLGLDGNLITDISFDNEDIDKIWLGTDVGVLYTESQGEAWEYRGPINDLITSLANNPNNPSELFAGTMNGIYRSLDGGVTWLGPYLKKEVVTSIKYSKTDHSNVYIGCLHGSLYLSENGGNSWSKIRKTDKQGSVSLAVDPYQDGVVYIGPSNKGIYKTVNNGESWEYLGLNGVSISSIILPETSENMLLVGSDDQKGFFFSTDGGESWINKGTINDQILTMSVDSSNPYSILISTRNSGILMSNDLGSKWEDLGFEDISLSTGFFPNKIKIYNENNKYNLIGYNNRIGGLYESKDGGLTWKPLLGNDDILKYRIADLVIDKDNHDHLLLSVYGGGVFESNDHGSSWKEITNNLPIGGYAILSLTNNGNIISGPSDQGVWILGPNEKEWKRSNLADFSIEYIYSDFDHNEDIYALDSNGSLHISNDKGISWKTISITFSDISIGGGKSKNIIGITSDNRVLVSSNKGLDWKETYKFNLSSEFSQKSIISSKDTEYYYIRKEDVLLTSSDNGITWTEYKLPGYGEIGPSKVELLYFISDNSIYRSNNAGKDFYRLNNSNLVDISTNSLQINNDTFLIGTYNNGIFISFDKAESWNETTIGEGYNVLALAKGLGDSENYFGLLSSSDGVTIAKSKDGFVWSQKPTECNSSIQYLGFLNESDSNFYPENYFFDEIEYKDGKIWEFICGETNQLFVIRAGKNFSEYIIDINKFSEYIISDILFVSEEKVYLLTNNSKVYFTDNLGKKWKLIGDFGDGYDYKFTNNLGTNSYLYKTEGDLIVAGYRPVITQPIISYMLLGYFIVTTAVIIFVKEGKEAIINDVKRIIYWTFSRFDIDSRKTSIWSKLIVIPLFLSSAILIYQMAPNNKIISDKLILENYYFEFYSLIQKLYELDISIFTTEGNLIFSFFIYLFSIIILFPIVLSMIACNDKDIKISNLYKRFPRLFIESAFNGMSVFVFCFLILIIIGVFINNDFYGSDYHFLGMDSSEILGLIGFVLLYKIFSVILIYILESTEINYIYLLISSIIALSGIIFVIEYIFVGLINILDNYFSYFAIRNIMVLFDYQLIILVYMLFLLVFSVLHEEYLN